MNDDLAPFNRGAIRPIECMREGWQLIKEQYWLFVGISLVGALIAGAGPMGILAGPMVCGMYHCVFLRANGREVEFGMLFKGFDYFTACLIPALVMTGILMVFFVGGYVVFIIGFFAIIGGMGPPQPGQPPAAFLGAFFGLYGAFLLFVIVVAVVVRSLFFFAFPLVMDRGLSGWDAVKLSVRAMWGNLGGVLGVLLLIEFLGLVSSLLCCVGPILELPINVAMMAVAYRKVFPERGALADYEPDDTPDDDDAVDGPSDTGIRSDDSA